MRLLNEAPGLDAGGLVAAADDALSATDAIEGQVRAGLPLLLRAQGIDRARAAFDTALDAQRAALRRVQAVAREAEWDILTHALEQVESAAAALGDAVSELQAVKDTMPRFSDDRLLNEVLTLGLSAMRGESDALDSLRERMRPLYELTRYLERALTQFRQRHPSETAVIARCEPALEDLRQATGGIFVFLEEGRRADLSNALTLLDRSMSALAACLAAMRMVEHDASRFSENPVVERLHAAVEQGSDLREAVDRTTALLGALRHDVQVLDERVWMGEDLKREVVPLLREYLDQMDRAVADIARGAPPQEPLERLRWLSQQFDDLQEDLEERLLDRPDLSRAGHFQELVTLMEGVYAGQVPDRALREQVEMLSRMQEAFRGRLQLHAVHHPEEHEQAAAVLRCLDAQQVGLERVLDYLASGDRGMLAAAFDAIVGPTLELIATRVDEEPSGAAASETSCPFCGAANGAGTSRCAQCARPLPVLASLSGGLDLYDGGAAPAEETLSENFGFVVQVIDDVEGGLLEPEQARELLAPFWDTVHTVEQRSRAEVQPRVDALGDEARSRSQEDFTALLQAVKDAMADLLSGLADGRRAGYGDVRERMVDLAGLIGYVHREQATASDPPH